jgi:hypothetical protein
MSDIAMANGGSGRSTRIDSPIRTETINELQCLDGRTWTSVWALDCRLVSDAGDDGLAGE